MAYFVNYIHSYNFLKYLIINLDKISSTEAAASALKQGAIIIQGFQEEALLKESLVSKKICEI